MEKDSPIEGNRVGRFFISKLIILTLPYDVLMKFMSNFFVVRAESMYARHGIEYTAYSGLFGIVDDGEEIPHYYTVTSPSGVLSVRKEG